MFLGKNCNFKSVIYAFFLLASFCLMPSNESHAASIINSYEISSGIKGGQGRTAAYLYRDTIYLTPFDLSKGELNSIDFQYEINLSARQIFKVNQEFSSTWPQIEYMFAIQGLGVDASVVPRSVADWMLPDYPVSPPGFDVSKTWIYSGSSSTPISNSEYDSSFNAVSVYAMFSAYIEILENFVTPPTFASSEASSLLKFSVTYNYTPFVSSVPEVSTWIEMIVGFFGIALAMRSRRLFSV